MLPEALAKVKVGYGMEPGVTMGPVISARHRDRVLAYIDKGVREGAKLVVDGRGCKVDGYPKGHWVGPTFFTGVTPQMTIGHEEIFGPVLCLMRAKDIDEALRIVHAHPLANASSIYTSNGAHARRWCKEVDASMVGVNIGVAAPMAMFGFGGAKGSFLGDLKAHGREQIAVLHAEQDEHREVVVMSRKVHSRAHPGIDAVRGELVDREDQERGAREAPAAHRGGRQARRPDPRPAGDLQRPVLLPEPGPQVVRRRRARPRPHDGEDAGVAKRTRW